MSEVISATGMFDERAGAAREDVTDGPETVEAADEPNAAALCGERSLLRRLQRGDERAFVELVRSNQDRVFELVLRMLGDREEALDLSQEIFVSIHASVARFRGDSRLSTWVFRIARNHCLNRLKYLDRRMRRRSRCIGEVSEGELERQSPSERPDERVAEGERRALAQRAIAQLPEDQRLLVILRDLEDLSYQEIVAITGQPEGTVKSRLHRARLALAEIVARLEED